MSSAKRDTQWPRFEVFLQARVDQPHKNVGSVHAPDVEMALQNARDVFVRRPACVSLWVAPAGAILARTREELALAEVVGDTPAGAEESCYYVFQKLGQRQSMVYVTHTGEVQAASAAQALQRAVAQYDTPDTYVWWVCPAGAIVRSQEEEIPSLFEPAVVKTYRRPQEYRTVTQMHEIRYARSNDDGAGDAPAGDAAAETG